jgi:hypothetical protein
MSDVWVVRDGLEEVQAAFPTEKAAVNYTHGWVGDGLLSITRETLLTPEMEAVIEKAKRQADAGRRWETCTCGGRCAHEINYEMACSDTDFAVSTLRAVEGDA